MDMTKGPFTKNIISFSLPLLFTSVLQVLYNAADIVVVGKFAGPLALAAVSSNGAVVNLILNLFMGFAIGTGVVVARYIGAEDKKAVFRSVHTAMALSLIVGISALVAGEVFAKTMLQVMDVPSDIIDLSALYLRIFFLGAPASMVFNFGAAILRANGDTRRPMFISAMSGILNVILNLILVIVFHLDVAGVAIATIISQYMSAIWISLILIKRTDSSRVIISKIKIHSEELKDIIKIGLPTGMQSTFFSLSNVVIQSSINSFGAIAIAGNGAASNVDNVVYVCIDAFAQAATTFAAQNIGAKNYNNVNKVFRSCMGLVSIVGIFTGIVAAVFAEFFMGFFSNDPEVIAVGAEKTRFISTFYFICGYMNCAAGTLRSLGKSFTTMIIVLLGTCALRVVWIVFIFPIKPTLPVLYLTYLVSWIVTFVFCYIFYKIELNKQKKSLIIT